MAMAKPPPKSIFAHKYGIHPMYSYLKVVQSAASSLECRYFCSERCNAATFIGACSLGIVMATSSPPIESAIRPVAGGMFLRSKQWEQPCAPWT